MATRTCSSAAWEEEPLGGRGCVREVVAALLFGLYWDLFSFCCVPVVSLVATCINDQFQSAPLVWCSLQEGV